jgi:hypothetical protein
MNVSVQTTMSIWEFFIVDRFFSNEYPKKRLFFRIVKKKEPNYHE